MKQLLKNSRPNVVLPKILPTDNYLFVCKHTIKDEIEKVY